jgi:hypothetical protein
MKESKYGNVASNPDSSRSEGGEVNRPPISGPTTPPSQLNIGRYPNAAPRFEGSDNSPMIVGAIWPLVLNNPTKIWPVIAYYQL